MPGAYPPYPGKTERLNVMLLGDALIERIDRYVCEHTSKSFSSADAAMEQLVRY
ncbi:hypothetical protein ACXX9E_28880 [Pseudomonas sp. GNP014]